MTDETPQNRNARQDREQRLAAELRENLKKRKAQARARKSGDTTGKNADR